MSAGGGGAALHFSVASSTSPAHVRLDACDGVLGHAELLQAGAIKRDRSVSLPSLKLAVGAIFRRIGAGMPAVAGR